MQDTHDGAHAVFVRFPLPLGDVPVQVRMMRAFLFLDAPAGGPQGFRDEVLLGAVQLRPRC